MKSFSEQMEEEDQTIREEDVINNDDEDNWYSYFCSN